MIKSWFKIFYRNSKKNSLNLIINILGLTLGFAGLMFVLLYLNNEKSYNQWNPEKENIYRVLHRMSDGKISDIGPSAEGPAFEEDIPEVLDFYLASGWYYDSMAKIDGKNKYTKYILNGESNFFDYFPFKVIQGTASAFKESRDNIGISSDLAVLYFGNGNVIGESITIDDRLFTISTVFEGNKKSYFNPKLVKQYEEKLDNSNWSSFSKNMLIKLSEGADIKDVEAKMNSIVEKHITIPAAKTRNIDLAKYKEEYGISIVLEKLTDIRLHSVSDSGGPEGKGNYQLIIIMLGLSVLLVIISCVNFINLSTASASGRSKEVGVKKTLGLSKKTIAVQYILEILAQGLVAFVFALIMVELLMPYFNDFMSKELSITDGSVLMNISVIAVLTSVLVGVIPSVYISNFKTVEVLKGNVSGSKNGIIIRNAMLGLQFLISGFFLIGAMIIYYQVNYMINKDLGFSGEQILVVEMDEFENRYKKYQTLKKELIKHPNINVITSNFYMPGGTYSNSTAVTYKDYKSVANSNAIDFGYLDMVKIKILKGRDLNIDFASDSISNILINETLAKELSIYNDPIGKEVEVGFRSANGMKRTVVGMIKDYHIDGFDKKINPMFIMHWNMYSWMKRYNMYAVQFKVNAQNMDETIKYIEEYWGVNVDPGYPFNYRFLDQQFNKTFEKHHKQKTLFSILTAVVILISLLGLFALATLNIQQRLNEVAIRKTLGASTKEIMYELIKGFIKIVLLVSVFLIPLAYYFMQIWLDNFIYKVDMPLLPYLIAPVVLIILVIIVVGYKAFRATKIDLIKHLKFE